MHENKTVFITYTLADGESIQIEVTQAIANVLKETDLKERALEKQDKRNIDFRKLEHYEDRLMNPTELLLDSLIRRESYEQLHSAMEDLTEKQRRRIESYFFDELNYRQIAELEQVGHKAIMRSVHSALKKLNKILE